MNKVEFLEALHNRRVELIDKKYSEEGLTNEEQKELGRIQIQTDWFLNKHMKLGFLERIKKS